MELRRSCKFVLPKEMSSGFPYEALKAQAVCARTYALRQISDKKLEKYNKLFDEHEALKSDFAEVK